LKKVVGIFTILFAVAFLPAVYAEQTNSVVIIDTAVDTNAKDLVGRVIYEVCIMETPRCPNGTNFMEGSGSASLPIDQVYKGGFDHGTIMASIAANTNKKVNIVFIRIVPMSVNKTTGVYTDNAVVQALNWVAKNKDKFNIVATSASIGHHNFKTLTNYCPIKLSLRESIIQLKNAGVATMFAAGNNGLKGQGADLSRVDYPSCIPEAISVGATNLNNGIESYSNGGSDLDFYALGRHSVFSGTVLGTSGSSAALAGYWAKVYKGDYNSTYEHLKSVSKPASNARVKTTLFVDILG